MSSIRLNLAHWLAADIVLYNCVEIHAIADWVSESEFVSVTWLTSVCSYVVGVLAVVLQCRLSLADILLVPRRNDVPWSVYL